MVTSTALPAWCWQDITYVVMWKRQRNKGNAAMMVKYEVRYMEIT